MKENPNNLPVVSYSKLTTYKNCPKAYKFIYIEKLPRLDKPYTVFGNFCHDTLEDFHKAYIDKSEDSADIVMKKSFINAKRKWEAKLTREQITEGFEIMQTYLDSLPDKMPNVIDVEKEIWLPIDNELIFYGFIDRVQIDEDGIVHIVDYKTTKDPRFLKDRTQLLLYAYALYIEDIKISKMRTSFILLKHKMKYLSADNVVDDLLKAKNSLLDMWGRIQLDQLYRASPIEYKCKNCDYLEKCSEGQKLIYKVKGKAGEINWDKGEE